MSSSFFHSIFISCSCRRCQNINQPSPRFSFPLRVLSLLHVQSVHGTPVYILEARHVHIRQTVALIRVSGQTLLRGSCHRSGRSVVVVLLLMMSRGSRSMSSSTLLVLVRVWVLVLMGTIARIRWLWLLLGRGVSCGRTRWDWIRRISAEEITKLIKLLQEHIHKAKPELT